ncbi:hypothetical protein ACN9M0_31670 [Streptomyces sp. R-07]
MGRKRLFALGDRTEAARKDAPESPLDVPSADEWPVPPSARRHRG